MKTNETKFLHIDFIIKMLSDLGIKFDSKNSGIHLVVHSDDYVIDFFPTTGLWNCRTSKIKGRGILNLLGHLHIKFKFERIYEN